MVTPLLYLLDTNMVSYITTGKSQSAQERYYDQFDQARIVISALTEGEIRFGMAKRPEAVRMNSFMLRFLAETESLPWESTIASTYGNLRAMLAKSGKSLSPLDSLIAAHALTLNAILVSHDSAFSRLLPLLTVQDWATDL